ncbi:glycosyl transferase [Lysobacteraceae bacterium NML07-0707]|nr:glycosyl transferase [Xanthomonadaceae bacterium NML07-0707]
MCRRLTVVQLLPALQSGGVERSTLEIAQALVEAGHRAIVVSAGGRLLPQLQAAGGEHIQLDIGKKSLLTLTRVGALRRILRDVQADIVHARSRLPAWLGHWALAGMPAEQRPRWLTTMHGLNSPSRYSRIMTSGERVICVSDTVRQYLLQHYPETDPGKLRVIARGIQARDFSRRQQVDHHLRAQFSQAIPQIAGDGPLLLMPGRGTRLKGHEEALKLLAAVRAQGVDARLWMPGAREAGREAYLAELETQAAQMGVADVVAMTPPIALNGTVYAMSDLVLQLSRKPEAFGRTVVEALSVGVPVLGWAHGGVGELLAGLQPEGAVPPFDADALAAHALQLLHYPPSPPLNMPYSLQAMQQATLSVYQELA